MPSKAPPFRGIGAHFGPMGEAFEKPLDPVAQTFALLRLPGRERDAGRAPKGPQGISESSPGRRPLQRPEPGRIPRQGLWLHAAGRRNSAPLCPLLTRSREQFAF